MSIVTDYCDNCHGLSRQLSHCSPQKRPPVHVENHALHPIGAPAAAPLAPRRRAQARRGAEQVLRDNWQRARRRARRRRHPHPCRPHIPRELGGEAQREAAGSGPARSRRRRERQRRRGQGRRRDPLGAAPAQLGAVVARRLLRRTQSRSLGADRGAMRVQGQPVQHHDSERQ